VSACGGAVVAVASCTFMSVHCRVQLLAPPQVPAAQALDLIRSGQHPFELQGIGHLLPKVQQQLSQLLAQHHRSFGSNLSFSNDSMPAKDKQQQHMAIFSSIIRLVPYLKLEQWPVLRPLDLLPA